jgi:hypothetical protein
MHAKAAHTIAPAHQRNNNLDEKFLAQEILSWGPKFALQTLFG